MATNANVFEVRLLVKEPMGFIAIVEVANEAALPVTPAAQTLYFVADKGEYQAFSATWTRQDLVVSDMRIKTLYDLYQDSAKVASKIINDLIVHYGQLLALAYKSHSDGSESFEKHTLADVVAFYKELRATFQEEANSNAGTVTGFYARTKRQRIGGML